MIHHYYVVVLIVRVIDDEAEILLVKRAPGRYMSDTWQLVSGSLEPGEEAWRSALREMREETGLVPFELYRLSTLTRFYRSDIDSINTAPMFCALVTDAARPVPNDELTAVEWVNIFDARSWLMWPADREAIDEVVAVILGNGSAKPFLRIQI
jgi:dATP pyrophosphohydrolase